MKKTLWIVLLCASAMAACATPSVASRPAFSEESTYKIKKGVTERAAVVALLGNPVVKMTVPIEASKTCRDQWQYQASFPTPEGRTRSLVVLVLFDDDGIVCDLQRSEGTF